MRRDECGGARENGPGEGGRKVQESRVAVIGIIVEDKNKADEVNSLLHQYSQYIIGRMGLPYRERKVSIISVIIDASSDVISALSGKLGRIPGVSTQALYTKV